MGLYYKPPTGSFAIYRGGFAAFCRIFTGFALIFLGLEYMVGFTPLKFHVQAVTDPGQTWLDVDPKYRALYYPMRILMGSGCFAAGVGAWLFYDNKLAFAVIALPYVWSVWTVIVWVRSTTNGAPPFEIATILVLVCIIGSIF